MGALRGMNIVELDPHASTADRPYGIISVDCKDPFEIDDGIFVDPLPTAQEAYRVGVCVVDASGLYHENAIHGQARNNLEAEYWELLGNKYAYKPMIDPEIIRSREFKQGQVRDALIVSFVIGKRSPPSDVTINFGRVETTDNLHYRKFARGFGPEKKYARFERASHLLLRHLELASKKGYFGESPNRLRNGAQANALFMLAANHLVGRMMESESRLAIYRVFDPEAAIVTSDIPPDVARFSTQPGRHARLISPYCRVTSPLRRYEDFVMSHLLKQYSQGRQPTWKDYETTGEAVDLLNDRIASRHAHVVHALWIPDDLNVVQLGASPPHDAEVVYLSPELSEVPA